MCVHVLGHAGIRVCVEDQVEVSMCVDGHVRVSMCVDGYVGVSMCVEDQVEGVHVCVAGGDPVQGS